jgi:hypothetical protein
MAGIYVEQQGLAGPSQFFENKLAAKRFDVQLNRLLSYRVIQILNAVLQRLANYVSSSLDLLETPRRAIRSTERLYTFLEPLPAPAHWLSTKCRHASCVFYYAMISISQGSAYLAYRQRRGACHFTLS